MAPKTGLTFTFLLICCLARSGSASQLVDAKVEAKLVPSPVEYAVLLPDGYGIEEWEAQIRQPMWPCREATGEWMVDGVRLKICNRSRLRYDGASARFGTRCYYNQDEWRMKCFKTCASARGCY